MFLRNTFLAIRDRGSARFWGRFFLVLELVFLAFVLGFAWKKWSNWPGVPLADPDTWGYLNPALDWLGGYGFNQAGGRDWFYPAFVALFLKTTGTFSGIVVWQRSLALLAGVLMAVTWRLWVSMMPVHRGLLFGLSIVGLLPIAGQLVNEQNMLFTMSIRPEAILPFFVYGQLMCLMTYCKYRWHSPRPGPALAWGAAAILLAYACFLLKPSWYLATAATVFPVFCGLFGRSLPLWNRILTPIVGAVVTLGLCWLPGKVWFHRDAPSVTLLPLALFCVHAELIDHAWEAKLATLPDSDAQKAQLRHLDEVLKAENQLAKEAYRPYDLLRINPDLLLDSHPLNAAIFAAAGNDPEKIKSFCFGAFKDAVLYDPRAYASKVGRQFTRFLYPDAKTFFKDVGNLTQEYELSAQSMAAHRLEKMAPSIATEEKHYREDITAQLRTRVESHKNPKRSRWGTFYARWSLPVELTFVVALLFASIYQPLRALRPAGWAACFLFFAPFANALGVCFVHALDIYRYRATYGGYLLFALYAMAIFAVISIVQAAWTVALQLRNRSSTAAVNPTSL